MSLVTGDPATLCIVCLLLKREIFNVEDKKTQDYFHGFLNNGGEDRVKYYKDCWDNDMSFKQKLDYFVSYYSRLYGVRISNDVSNLIKSYNANAESVCDEK